MYPQICTIGPFTLYSYGLMLVIAFFTASFLAAKQAKREGLNADFIFNLTFIIFICGIIGSRIFFVLENIQTYLENPREIIMLQHGGLSWFGGLILGSAAGAIYLKKKKIAVLKTLDLLAPYIALAQAIGRIGCFLNGCCYGKETFIPAQIFSSLLLLVIFVVLRLRQEKTHPEGGIFFLYLLLYSLKRFAIEFFRADNPCILFGLTLFQLLSIVLFFLSISMLIKLRPIK